MKCVPFSSHLSLHSRRYEICYSADDLLPVCEELGIPLVVSTSLAFLLQTATEVNESSITTTTG